MTEHEDPALIALKEAMNDEFVSPPEFDDFMALVQSQASSVAVRKDPTQPWGESNRAKCKAIWLTGLPRVGKSDLAEMAVSEIENVVTTDNVIIEARWKLAECPSMFDHKLMLNELLLQIGYKSRPLPAKLAWLRLERNLAVFRPTVIVLDEFQCAFRPTGVGKHRLDDVNLETAGMFRRILEHPNWPVPLIFVGLPAAREVLERPDMEFFRERINPFELKSMRQGDPLEIARLKGALDAYCKCAKVANGLVDADFYKRLIHASNNARGLGLETAKEAVISAWKTKTDLQARHFADLYRERARVGDQENPFISSGWQSTDRSRLLKSLLVAGKPAPAKGRT